MGPATAPAAAVVAGRASRYRRPPMKTARRALVALGVAGLFAAVLRVRGTGGTPPKGGGWRELSGPDLT